MQPENFKYYYDPECQNILLIDNEPRALIGKNIEIEKARQFSWDKNCYILEDFFRYRVVVYTDFNNLKSEISKILTLIPENSIKFMIEYIEKFVDDAKDCICIKERRIELSSFLYDLIVEHMAMEMDSNSSDRTKGVRDNILTFFHDIEYHGFDIPSDAFNIGQIIEYEIVEYWGGIAWDTAEMEINMMSPTELQNLDFADFVEFLRGVCSEI